MPVSAILVIENRSILRPPDELVPVDGRQVLAKPFALLEILGQSVVERTVTRLRTVGVKTVSVVHEAALSPVTALRFIPEVLTRHASQGFDKVLLIRVGAYAEVDLVEFLQFHREKGLAVTRACDAYGPLDFWVLDALPKKQFGLNLDSLSDSRVPATYLTKGYVNRLTEARDLRRLVVDAFLGQCAFRPRGKEVRPGVWVDDGARVHRTARVVAPAYIGQSARVRASALITRFSNLERRSLVDYGTAVEDSSILPYTYVGRALDLAHAVVDGNYLVNLSRNAAVTIDDSKMIGRTLSQRRRFGFGYGGRQAEALGALHNDVIQLEPMPHVSAKSRTVLPILSKGEV